MGGYGTNMGQTKLYASFRPQEWSSEHPSRERMRVAPEVVAIHMTICSECGELRGRFIDPYDRAERMQTCACPHSDGRTTQGVPWPRYDLNAVVEPCFCCANLLIHTGTLSSPLFCETCLGWAAQLNENEGRVVIPQDRQAASDAANVGMLAVLGRMKAYRLAKIRAQLAMWFGAVPRDGVPTRELVRRASAPTYETFKTFVLAVVPTAAPVVG